MSLAVVTSCSAEGWLVYGRRFVETYVKHWPAEIPLYVVSEDVLPPLMGATHLHLMGSEAASAFLKRNDNPRTRGRVRKSSDAGWTPNKISAGYNFRYDAFRFCKKVFAIDYVARRWTSGGKLFWVDMDVVTFADVPTSLLHRLLPADKALSCLDRGQYHSECGFVGYNLDHPQGMPFIAAFAELYASDEVFKLQEWHDSWVFDWLRRKMNVPTFAIPHQSRRHPFVNSELGRHMDHLKGARKAGGTPSREVVTNRDVGYWQGKVA